MDSVISLSIGNAKDEFPKALRFGPCHSEQKAGGRLRY